MRSILLVLALLLGLGVTAQAAPPYRGETVLYKQDSTHSFNAVVTRVIDSDTADLTLTSWGTLWTIGSTIYTSEATPVTYLPAVDRGSGDGQWLENALVFSGSHITAISTPTLALDGAAVQFSSTKEAIYTASLGVDTVYTLLGGGERGHIDLLCDSNGTPTTLVGRVQAESNDSGGVTTFINSHISQVSWRLSAGDYCRLVTTADIGTPTFSVVGQKLQTLE